MKRASMLALAVCAVAGLTTLAAGQSINFTINSTTGAGSTPPSNAFGGAANQPGFWNSHSGTLTAGTPIAMNDLAGNATGITMTITQGLSVNALGSTTNNLGGATPDMQGLLSGVWDLGGTTAAQRTFTFSGLSNGTYSVYTYAMAPDSGTFITRVNVNGNAGAGDPGVQMVGGPFGGDFALGGTHALHQDILVTDGTLYVTTTTATSFGSLAGFQLMMIPSPGALALLGLAGLVSSRRRRS